MNKSENSINYFISKNSNKRKGKILFFLDFISLVFVVLPCCVVILFEIILSFFLKDLSILGNGIDLLIIPYIFLNIMSIKYFYFKQLSSKLYYKINYIVLSLCSIINLLLFFVTSSMIYSFFYDEENFYSVDVNSLFYNIIFFTIGVLIVFLIISTFASNFDIKFELFFILILSIFLLIKLISLFTFEKWQIVTIIYTMAILILSNENINLFTNEKIDLDKYKGKINEILSMYKLIIGIVPISLYSAIYLEKKYKIDIFSNNEVFKMFQNKDEIDIYIISLCIYILMFIFVNFILYLLRRYIKKNIIEENTSRNKFMKEIGFINKTIRSKLNISTNADKVFISDGLIKHLEKRNKQNIFKYLNEIENIINNPDYIGINPREKETSLEYVKILSDNVLVGIKLDMKNDYFYVATIHEISNLKLNQRIKNGRLLIFDND